MELPALPQLDFLAPGTPTGPGLNFPTGPGFDLYAPIQIPTGPGPGNKTPTAPAPTTSIGTTLQTAASLFACFMSPGSCLLRLVFLILGLICIAGAIYLYKPTSEIIAAPARAVKTAATTAAIA